MQTIQSPEVKETPDTRIDNASGPKTDNRISPQGLISVIAESLLAGLALFLAFLIQQSYFDMQNRQFLIGRGELINMSAGIAFCYAFVSVLRRVYLNKTVSGIGKSFRRISRTLIETYIFYLALLFLVKDIDFVSVKLAVGIAFILNAAVVFPYRYLAARIFNPAKNISVPRKITLKKRASSPVPERRPLYRMEDSGFSPSDRSENRISKSTAITTDSDEISGKRDHSVYSDFFYE